MRRRRATSFRAIEHSRAMLAGIDCPRCSHRIGLLGRGSFTPALSCSGASRLADFPGDALRQCWLTLVLSVPLSHCISASRSLPNRQVDQRPFPRVSCDRHLIGPCSEAQSVAICGNLLASSCGAQPLEDKPSRCWNTTSLSQTAPRSRRDCVTMPSPDCGFPRQKETDLQNPGVVNVTAIITVRRFHFKGKRLIGLALVMTNVGDCELGTCSSIKEMARARYDATAFSNQTTGLPNRGAAACQNRGVFFFVLFFAWAIDCVIPTMIR